jgi:hypothetical protein
MKKIVFYSILTSTCFILCILNTGCSNNKQKKLIESFISTSDGVISDLKFKMIKLDEKSPITVSDSIVFLVIGNIPIKYLWVGDSIKGTYPNEKGTSNPFAFSKSTIDTLLSSQVDYKSYLLSSINKINIEIGKLQFDEATDPNPYINYSSFINRYEEMKDKYKQKLDNEVATRIQELKLVKKYFQIPLETILLRAFDCTYSIFNPALQVKQTQTKTFYFDKDLTKVIR